MAQALAHEEMSADFELFQDLRVLDSRALLRQAARLRVPVTHSYGEEREGWSRSMEGDWYLNDEGYQKIRADVRAELKARDERRLSWLTVIVAVSRN